MYIQSSCKRAYIIGCNSVDLLRRVTMKEVNVSNEIKVDKMLKWGLTLAVIVKGRHA
jgi:hypothetical protein